MAAGLETLRHAAENGVWDHVDALGDRLRNGLEDIVADQAPAYSVVGTDSMFKVIFTREGPEGVPRNGADVKRAETERWERLFWPAMEEQGVFLTANQFESQFLSASRTDEDVETLLEAYKEAL